MRYFFTTLWIALIPCARAQYFEPPPINPDPSSEVSVRPVPAPQPAGGKSEQPAPNDPATVTELPDNSSPVPREKTRVAVLGYHNFSDTKPVSEMLMRTSEFRQQMEYIHKAGLRVISMKEFLDWRLGNLQLPPRCVLITLDDGWRSVYTDAFPILKEYGYPFTLFLYTKYLSGRGDSMTPEMVREMQAHGATIGSHSTSHLYPRFWKRAQAEGDKAYNELMDVEMGGSFKRLGELFGPINTYCYPGGYVTPQMIERLPGYGFVAAFTVIPGKVDCTEDVFQVHRYMVFGTDSSIFRHAVDFRQLSAATGGDRKNAGAPSPVPPFPVYPLPNSVAHSDISLISAQLSGMTNVEPNSIQMQVSGFGRVPAKVDSSTLSVQWAPPLRIYLPRLTVRLSWKTTDGSSHSAEWFFYIESEPQIQSS